MHINTDILQRSQNISSQKEKKMLWNGTKKEKYQNTQNTKTAFPNKADKSAGPRLPWLPCRQSHRHCRRDRRDEASTRTPRGRDGQTGWTGPAAAAQTHAGTVSVTSTSAVTCREVSLRPHQRLTVAVLQPAAHVQSGLS